MPQESLLFDLNGNRFQGTVDVIGGETITDARTGAATLGALNAELIMDIQGKATARWEIRTGAMNASLVFEGTMDGANYFSIVALDESTESFISSITITTTLAATYVIGTVGWRRVRCRVSAYTSGNCVVTGRGTEAVHDVLVRSTPATAHITATGAANAIVTATLPAPGIGLYHFIVNIHLMRSSTAALAGTATLTHTTTNLPGSPAWTVGNAMIAGGTQQDLNFTPVTPLESSASNTATTIVMPAAGAAVINRINVTYYIGA